MTPERIERLADLAARAGIEELEVTEGETSLRLRLATEPLPASPRPSTHLITSPAVGFFRSRHPLSARPAAEPGGRVVKGEIVGFVANGHCLYPVLSPEYGTLSEALVADGSPVGFGTPLHRLARPVRTTRGAHRA